MPSSASRSSTRPAASSRPRPMLSGPKANSSRTVGENSWASVFWKTNPRRDRNAWLSCSSSRDVRGDVLVEGAVAAGVGEEQAGQDLEQRRLAAPVRPEQRDSLAPLDRQAHRVERGEPAEVGVAERVSGEHRPVAGGRARLGIRAARPWPTARVAAATATTTVRAARSATASVGGGEGAGLTDIAPGNHGLVDLAGQLVGLAEQHAGGCAHEAARLERWLSGFTVRARRAVYRSVTESSR